MSTSPKPKDWSDPAGWDKYYSDLIADDYAADVWDTGTISVDRVPQLISELKSKSLLNVWVPGCGISLLPRLLFRGGLHAWATDVSRRAVEFQNASNAKIDDLLSKSNVEEAEGGKFTAEVHDFRTPYLSDQFDLTINVKAIQAFPPDEMRKIVSVHFDALKGGGQAIFDTLNVQGDSRETLEKVLVDAGFYLPFYEINVEYRRSLNETGIPYVFVLGQPIIPWVGEYENGEKRESDMNVLRDISAKHAEKLRAENESVAAHYKDYPQTKTATIFYSTG